MITLHHEAILVNAIERARQLAEQYAANREALCRLRPGVDRIPAVAGERDWSMRPLFTGPAGGGDEDPRGPRLVDRLDVEDAGREGGGGAAGGRPAPRGLRRQESPGAAIPIGDGAPDSADPARTAPHSTEATRQDGSRDTISRRARPRYVRIVSSAATAESVSIKG
jgi:hypothetical protein